MTGSLALRRAAGPERVAAVLVGLAVALGLAIVAIGPRIGSDTGRTPAPSGAPSSAPEPTHPAASSVVSGTSKAVAALDAAVARSAADIRVAVETRPVHVGGIVLALRDMNQLLVSYLPTVEAVASDPLSGDAGARLAAGIDSVRAQIRSTLGIAQSDGRAYVDGGKAVLKRLAEFDGILTEVSRRLGTAASPGSSSSPGP